MNFGELEISLLLISVSILGAIIPYFFRENSSFLSLFTAVSAGLILGISLFHVSPNIIRIFGTSSIIYIQLAVLLPLLLDYVLKQIKDRSHADAHKIINPITILGFSLHAFVDGVLIVNNHINDHIGELTLLGILIHKLPVAFSLFVLLQTHVKPRKKAIIYFLIFTSMSPIGIYSGNYILELAGKRLLYFIGSFTAGMFIYIGFIHLFIDHKIYKEKKKLYFFAFALLISFLL